MSSGEITPWKGAVAEKPLGWMQTLSESVSYFDPKVEAAGSNNEPDLILIMSWMAAREAHISKYVAQYRKMFPSSRILVAQCPMAHVTFPWRTRGAIAPAIPFLRELAERQKKNDAAGDKSPKLLLQMFSNGGVHTASWIRRMLQEGQPDRRDVMPRYVMLMDSCPGQFRWQSSYRAVMQSLPWWSGPIIHAVIAMVCLYHYLRRLPPIQNRNAQALRSPKLLERECRRTYLYGTADDLVLWTDVEYNARKAKEAGFNVRMEKFQGARHVAITRSEPERYWRAIRESWYGNIDN